MTGKNLKPLSNHARSRSTAIKLSFRMEAPSIPPLGGLGDSQSASEEKEDEERRKGERERRKGPRGKGQKIKPRESQSNAGHYVRLRRGSLGSANILKVTSVYVQHVLFVMVFNLIEIRTRKENYSEVV